MSSISLIDALRKEMSYLIKLLVSMHFCSSLPCITNINRPFLKTVVIRMGKHWELVNRLIWAMVQSGNATQIKKEILSCLKTNVRLNRF